MNTFQPAETQLRHLLHRAVLALLVAALPILGAPDRALGQPQKPQSPGSTGLANPGGPGPVDPGIPVGHGLSFLPRAFPDSTTPALPSPEAFPIQLVLDDDQAEGVFGFAGSTARPFLWFQQFDNPGPFVLKEVWVLFPAEPDVPVGGDVQLAVYLDSDGNPANGAELLTAWYDVVQAADGDTFSVYPLPSDLLILDPGDILIGVVSRFFDPDTDPPPTRPAALDTTDSQDRAWYALWAEDPPPSPELDDALVIDVLDGAVSGNWMIRGFGAPAPVVEIPTLGHFALALLALLLGGAAVLRLRR